MSSFNEHDTRVSKKCKYNESNKRGNSSTKRVSLFVHPVYTVYRRYMTPNKRCAESLQMTSQDYRPYINY